MFFIYADWTQKGWQVITLVFSPSFPDQMYCKTYFVLFSKSLPSCLRLWKNIRSLRWCSLVVCHFLLLSGLAFCSSPVSSFVSLFSHLSLSLSSPPFLSSCHFSLCFCKYAALLSGSTSHQALILSKWQPHLPKSHIILLNSNTVVLTLWMQSNDSKWTTEIMSKSNAPHSTVQLECKGLFNVIMFYDMFILCYYVITLVHIFTT